MFFAIYSTGTFKQNKTMSSFFSSAQHTLEKWRHVPPFFIALDNRGIKIKVQIPGYRLGVHMFFTFKKRKVVRPLQHEIDQFIETRRGNYGVYSTATEHQRFIEQFVDSTGIKRVEDIDSGTVEAYLQAIRTQEQTESRRMLATVAIRQFIAYMDRKEIKQQHRKVGRPPKTERNMEMIALRKFDPQYWTIRKLAEKYAITVRAVHEIIDRHKDLLSS
jgi:hypothetical protein